MDKTARLKELIAQQYPSLRAFAIDAGIPYGTMVSALNNGIEGMSYGKVKTICECLNIDCGTFDPLVVNEEMSSEEKRMLSYYSRLDDVKKKKVLEYINDIS